MCQQRIQSKAVIFTRFQQTSISLNLVRDQGVGGSNPLSPTIIFNSLKYFPTCKDPQCKRNCMVRRPVGGWRRIEEIGLLVCCHCFDTAGFITGTEIMIDGG